LQYAAEDAFFESGEAGAAASSRSGDVYHFIQGDAASLDQDYTVRQTDGLGNIVSYEHGGEAAVSPNVFDELLHFDTGKRIE
jgi:hypothetical protein